MIQKDYAQFSVWSLYRWVIQIIDYALIIPQRSLRLVVRTLPSQGGNRGSTPLGSARLRSTISFKQVSMLNEMILRYFFLNRDKVSLTSGGASIPKCS